MGDSAFQTPILFLIYRRPDTTSRVFESIRSMRPRFLYVAADGPKTGDPNEALNCAEARRIATNVDWDCDLHTLLRNENLGCGPAVSSAISWFFENTPEGIVLEDDCVPSTTFYLFAEELLAYHRNDDRIMHIGGNNFQFGRRRGNASYYFSKYAHIWGWATWRRAWRHFDFTLIPEARRRNVWDAQWQRSIERERGFTIVPNSNLVSNIGFGPAGTNTLAPDRLSKLPALELSFPLKHPQQLAVDRSADTFSYYVHHRRVRFMKWIWIYRLEDYIHGHLKSLKRRLMGEGGLLSRP